MAKKTATSFADELAASTPTPKRCGVPSWFDSREGDVRDQLLEFKRRWRSGEYEAWDITDIYRRAKDRFGFTLSRCAFMAWLKRD
jgi:hypothetical protein